MAAEFSWSRQFEHRIEFANGYPGLFSIPLAPRPSAVLFRHLRDGMRVLDVGAGTRRAEERIRRRYPSVEYRSMDVDRFHRHDYSSIDDIRETFDMLLLFEVLEHIDINEGVRLLERLARTLTPGGLLLVTTPNVFHPTSFLRDATHCTPLAYDELGGLVTSCGYRVREIYRIYNAPWIQKVLRRFVAHPLHRLLGVDYARSVMLVAERAVGIEQ